MIEEDATIARLGFAAMLVFVSLLAAAFVCWLHEHGIHPSKPVIKFLHRPLGEVLIVLVCVGAFVHHGATKGFLGGPRMMAPREMQTELVSEPETSVPVAGMFSTYTNAVTNVCATGIKPAETSVFLRAHWPSNLYPAPTGIEVYVAPQLLTNAWVGVGTATVDANDNSTIIEIPYPLLPDGWASSMFFMFGLNIDTDGDGLSDAFERIVTKTDPNLADTDGDGMPDGWEYSNGLNPLSDSADDEANADPDGDGLSNIAEMDNGTDPQKRDSDDDGIDDLAELGAVRQLDDFVWYDTSGGLNILANEATSSIDDKVWTVALHYPAIISGTVYDRLTIDSNALVYLIPSNGVAVAQYRYSYDRLPANSLAQTNIAVAVNWRDMNLDVQNGSQIRVAAIASNNCSVVEFVNLEKRGYPLDRMTAQVVVPGGTNGTILVSYLTLSQNLDGRSASVGLMDSTTRTYTNTNEYYSLQWAYDEAGSIAPLTTLAYRVGTGTNPLEKDTDGDGLYDDVEIYVTGTDPCLYDTDGDGLSDGNEVGRQTNPLRVDTDGDGMPDGWEVANGLDPRVDDGALDADSDGLSNLLEWLNGTDPIDDDTDRDGLIDSREVAWIEEGDNLVPWFNIAALKEIEPMGEPSQALYDCDLPFTNWLAGGIVDVAVADVNGVVYFGNSATTNGLYSSTSGNNLTYNSGKDCALVAGYWGNLKLRTSLVSKITFGTAQHGGATHFVIQYENVGTYYGSASNKISFQVSVCESTPDVVFVRYGDVIDGRDGYSLSIGAQGGKDDNRDNYPKLNLFYGETPHPISNGRTIVYRFGCGGDPLEVDTDGDGLSDAEEVSIGTNPREKDSDGDRLDDAWEAEYGLDPLSAEGRDGEDGDPDNDGLSNLKEYEYGTCPNVADTDDDGLKDGLETGFVIVTNAVGWMSFDASEDITADLAIANRRCVSIGLPCELRIQGKIVTNVTISANGMMFLNRAGYFNQGNSSSGESFNYYVNRDAFVIAPYLDYAYIRSDVPGLETSVKTGTATHDGQGYWVWEYDNYYTDTSTWRTNSVCFQLSIPTNSPDRAYVRYGGLRSSDMDGRNACVGMQTFDGEWLHSYCYYDSGKICNGLCLEFLFGANSDPLESDTDGDGLSDAAELALDTNPNSVDSDGDGMTDGWEVQYGFNPCVAADADGDADNDGVSNLEECRYGSNPHSADTDGDGLSDGVEVELGTDLTNSDTDNDGLDDSYEYDAGLDPCHPDTDRDGLPDGWEVDHGLDPDCATGDDGTNGDPDHDGLSNIDEYQNGCDPKKPDTDRDRVSDGVEVGQGSDPTDASDHGIAPPADKFRELVFNINGDYAAWEMTIEGLGPDDTRTQVITMGAPGATREVPKKLRKGNSYRLSMRWLNCDGHNDSQAPWYCWQALIDGLPSQCSFNHSYIEGYCVRIPQRNNIVVGNGWIAENEGGLLTSHVHSSQKNSDGGSGAGNVAGGLVATLYVLDDPKLTSDYNGDGRIDQSDEAMFNDGRIFRFWVNDDKDDASSDGDVARNSKILDDGNDDIPTSGSDGLDDEVNGRRDLVDFTPIRVDLSKTVGSFPDAIRNGISFRLRQDDGALNVVWSNLSPSGANSFQTVGYASGFGRELRSSPQEAATEQVVSGGLPLPPAFEEAAKTGDGIFLVEGRCETVNPLVVEVVYENRVVCSNELRLSVTSVEDMYRWLGLRHVCGGQDLSGRSTAEPTNLPDCETVGPHYVFVHGYNVNAQSARGWAAEMFKRLWQAGARSKFTAVDWYGDESQFYLPTEGDVSPNYYINVEHAFMTAETLKNACAQLPGDKVMLAHSLGNMLVSAAAKDYDLQYTKYYMLNAAVPMEAYDVDAQNGLMIDGAWKDLGNRFRASHFYEAFASDPLDFRSKLSWKGRFAGIRNAINCYSPTEDVLKNPSQIKLFGVNVGEDYGGAWSKQELFKGCSLWYGVNSVTFAGTHIEGGWGGNANYLTRPLAYIPLVGFRASYFDGYTREDLITNALFTAFNDTRMALTNALNLVDSGLRAKMLGDAIPAESFAAGRNAINGVSQNFNFQGQNIPNWPKKSGSDNAWEHSDIKNVAYCFVHAIFDKMKRQD